VRTCPEHRLPLVVVSADLQSTYLHDFAYHAASTLPRLAELTAAARRRGPGPLETYVLARLDGAAKQSIHREPLTNLGALRRR
jgi:hypothetical protein